MSKIKTSIIVAMAQNNCIGKDNKMPWHIPDDLKRFKSLTMGKPVIMGRKTFDSILGYLKKPLPGRKNIVISRSDYQTAFNDVPVIDNINAAITHARSIAEAQKLTEIFIIGGAQIYTQSINQADCLHLTTVHRNVEGDAFFPELNMNEWNETDRIDHLDQDPPYSFVTLERK